MTEDNHLHLSLVVTAINTSAFFEIPKFLSQLTVAALRLPPFQSNPQNA